MHANSALIPELFKDCPLQSQSLAFSQNVLKRASFLMVMKSEDRVLKLNPFPNDKFQTCPNRKSLQTTISKLMKMAYSFLNGKKTMWKKEKLLVMSNFSFSRIVFKIHVLQTRKNQGLFGKGLIM